MGVPALIGLPPQPRGTGGVVGRTPRPGMASAGGAARPASIPADVAVSSSGGMGGESSRIGACRDPCPAGQLCGRLSGQGEVVSGGSPLALTRGSRSGGSHSAERRWPGPRGRRELRGQQRHEEERGSHGQGQVFPLGAGAADALLQLRHLRVEVFCGEEREGEEGSGAAPTPPPRCWGCPRGGGGGRGCGAAGPGAVPDSPRSSIFTSGRRVNWGRVGASFSPECDAVEGERGRGSCFLDALHRSSPSPPGGMGDPPASLAAPARPQPPGWARGYLLEAQQTNTFIFRQARRWLCVGVAARQERAERGSVAVIPTPGTPRLGGSGQRGVWSCPRVRSGLGECSNTPNPAPMPCTSTPALNPQPQHPNPAPVSGTNTALLQQQPLNPDPASAFCVLHHCPPAPHHALAPPTPIPTFSPSFSTSLSVPRNM